MTSEEYRARMRELMKAKTDRRVRRNRNRGRDRNRRDRTLMQTDPNSPGLLDILRGDKGPGWRWFAATGCLLLLFLNVLELLVVLR